MNWLANVWADFSKVFLEKGRYLSYLKGFGVTLEVSFFAVLLGVAVGALLAIVKYMAVRHKKFRLPGWIANVYITVIRGTPVYVQMLIIYFMIFTGRNSEIIRAGIEAVDAGQAEAGRSLGLSEMQTMKSIIMPQAIKNILPALGNEFIVLIKETAVIGNITVLDVTKAAQNIGNSTYNY